MFGLGTLFGVSIAFASIIAVIFWVLLVVANWKIFEKAGEAGWKSIIPIYSSYILFKITWNTKFFWITLVTGLLESLFLGLAGESFIWTVLGIAASVVLVILTVMQLSNLSRSFGHGAGYTLGLIFLPNVFTLILGFGSDQYVGPQH